MGVGDHRGCRRAGAFDAVPAQWEQPADHCDAAPLDLAPLEPWVSTSADGAGVALRSMMGCRHVDRRSRVALTLRHALGMPLYNLHAPLLRKLPDSVRRLYPLATSIKRGARELALRPPGNLVDAAKVPTPARFIWER